MMDVIVKKKNNSINWKSDCYLGFASKKKNKIKREIFVFIYNVSWMVYCFRKKSKLELKAKITKTNIRCRR